MNVRRFDLMTRVLGRRGIYVIRLGFVSGIGMSRPAAAAVPGARGLLRAQTFRY